MKRLLFLLAIFCTSQANAQPYSISFSGTDLSTVKVQNLTTGVIVDVPASDVLLLSTPTGIPEVNKKTSQMKLYPNPMTDKSTLEILPPIAGDAIISVCDMSGKVLTQFKGYVENYTQGFSLSGIKNGLYVINVQGNGYQFSEKLLSNGNSNGTASIVKISNNIQTVAQKKSLKDSKGIQGTVDMVYNAGERLKYTAVSGNNSTVMTNIPTADNTVSFSFTECKDGDNNYYPIVQINTQIWMAENLKTTKYNNGTTSIPNVTDAASWVTLTTHAYCWYSNDAITYKNVYGAVYNWYAVNSGNLCPTGWHVPTDVEFASLSTYLGGETVAGAKLKERGTNHWLSPNTGATNESGFTALAGGGCSTSGTFGDLKDTGYWWTATQFDSNEAWFFYLGYDNTNLKTTRDKKNIGMSVRCIKN